MNEILAPVAALQVPEAGALKQAPALALKYARTIVVADADDREMAVTEIRSVKSKLASLEEQRKTITVPLNKTLDAVNALFRGPRENLEAAESILKLAVTTYDDEQERIATAARRKAEAEAEELRAKAAAEAMRIADEAAAKRRADDEAAERLAAAGQSEEAEQVRAAAHREEQAQLAQAHAAASTAMVLTLPPASSAPPRSAGTSSRKALEFEVVDKLALVQHVAAHPDMLNLLVPDMVRLRALVMALGEKAQIPGVRVGTKTSLTVRKSRESVPA